MSNLTTQERETYEAVWQVPDYGTFSPGEQYAPILLSMLKHYDMHPRSVLDVGAGSGKGALALSSAGFKEVTMLDITDAGLCEEARKRTHHDEPSRIGFGKACIWRLLNSEFADYMWDVVYCTDVLEHVPEAFVGLAIQQMLLRLTDFGCLFISVANRHDQFGALVGRPLHLTVRDFVWWRDLLNELGTVIEARDLLGDSVFLVQGKGMSSVV